MKKLVLTMVALVAMATTSFAQYSDFEQMCSKVINDFYSSSSAPSVSFDLPSVSYSVPSTVNFNTTTVSGYTRSNGTYVESHIRTMPNDTNWDNFSRTTSPLKVTAIHLQVQQVIVQETIQETHTIMELVTQSILVPVEDSITTTAMDTRPTFQNETYGNYEESGSSSHKEQE